MSAFLESVIQKAKTDKKTIVLAEGNDERTLKAAERILAENIADLIIVGDAALIENSPYKVGAARIIDPATYEGRTHLAKQLAEIRKAKGMTYEQAFDLLEDELYLGVMLVKAGEANGMVAGACHSTADVLRPSLQIIKTAPNAKLASSFFVMVVPESTLGENGTFVFSDCALEVQPDAEKLASIAISAAQSYQSLVGDTPIVALLSHSTYGSAKNDDATKVVDALAYARAAAPDILIDGELQLDAAIVPEIGASKAPGSQVAGHANTLIFPDLDAGNIGYKLVQRLAKAEAYGPITQGLAAPINDLSRGCSAKDIYGVVAITAVQAQQITI